MANRCPDCNKFVGIEPGDPEVYSIEIDKGSVQAEVRLTLNCSECGGELNEYTFNLDAGSTEIELHIDAHEEAGDEYTLSVEEGDVESTDRFQSSDRNGKPIKNYRYMKHFYGVSLEAKVTCSCGEEFDLTLSDEAQASEFEQMY